MDAIRIVNYFYDTGHIPFNYSVAATRSSSKTTTARDWCMASDDPRSPAHASRDYMSPHVPCSIITLHTSIEREAAHEDQRTTPTMAHVWRLRAPMDFLFDYS